jgi:ornithine cyclodeaminase
MNRKNSQEDRALPNLFVCLAKNHVEELLDLSSVLKLVEESYITHAKGESNLSTPRALRVQSASTNLKISMLVKGATTESMLGCRIILDRIDTKSEGARFIVLSDEAARIPMFIINEDPIYTLRVGAQVAVAARYLAPQPVRRIGIIGTGRIAEGVVKALSATFSLEKVYVTSRRIESRRAFAERLSSALDLRFKLVSTVEDCCQKADIVVTATSANKPLISSKDLPHRPLLMPIGAGQELASEIIVRADKVLVDDWEYCTSIGDLAPLVADGRFLREHLYGQIGEVVAGFKSGREKADEQIVAIPQGLASADIAIAAWLANQAQRNGLGIQFSI